MQIYKKCENIMIQSRKQFNLFNLLESYFIREEKRNKVNNDIGNRRKYMYIELRYGNQNIGHYDIDSFQKEVVSFGRQSDNDIVLNFDFVSRLHGALYAENGLYYVEDLNSSNGLWVNGCRVQRQQLKHGDIISISGNNNGQYLEIVVYDIIKNETGYNGNDVEVPASGMNGNYRRIKRAVILCSALCAVMVGVIVGLVVYANRKKPSEEQVTTSEEVVMEDTTEATEGQITTEEFVEENTTEAVPEEMEDIGLSYNDLKNTSFSFTSGAGAWETNLSINEDGSFSGLFHDSEMGVTGEGYPGGMIYYSEFSGHFGTLEKIDEYTYATTIEDISYVNEPGTQEIKDEILYEYSDAYGLENAGRILFYLPGRPINEFSETEQSWINLYLYGNHGNKLSVVMLCNENECEVFCGSSGLPEQYQAYQGVVADAETTIYTYKDQVAYMDVTGDGVAELIYVAQNEQSYYGDLYIYTIENGKEKQICYFKDWDVPIAGGSYYFLFQREGDYLLYGMSVMVDACGTSERYYRFDVGQDGMLYPTEIMKWNDSGEVHDEFSYSVECNVDGNSVSSEDFFSGLEELTADMSTVLLSTYNDFDFETYYEDSPYSAPYFCIKPHYDDAMHIYVETYSAKYGGYRGSLIEQ